MVIFHCYVSSPEGNSSTAEPKKDPKDPKTRRPRRLLAHGPRDMAFIHALVTEYHGVTSLSIPVAVVKMWQVSPDVFNVRFGIPSINQPTNGKRISMFLISMFLAFSVGPDTKKPDFFDPWKLHLKSWALRTPWARPAERFAPEIAAAKSQLESARFADGSLTPAVCFDSTEPNTSQSMGWSFLTSKWVCLKIG